MTPRARRALDGRERGVGASRSARPEIAIARGIPISTQPFPPAAVVHADGDIHEADGAEGRRLLETFPELVRYALALLRSERRRAAFLWADPTGAWRRVSIERAPGVGGGEAAALTVEDEQLPFGLTARELDVLTLISGGLNNREIAARLATGVRTVATHVEHILAKLSQRSRSGASAVALDRGLVRLPIPGGCEGFEGLTIGALHDLASETPAPGRQGAPRALAPSWVRRPLLIGSALPLTGPARADGVEMRNGTALAIEEINARGGVGGRRLEHVVVPTDIFDEHSIRAAFDTLMSAEVDAVTSSYVFEEDAAMEPAAEYGAPFLHAMTSEHMAERTREDPARYRCVFQVCPSEVHYGRGFVRFLDEAEAGGLWRPHRRSVLFVETSLQSSQIATAETLERTERSGWRVAGVHHVAARDADWSGVVDMIQRTDPGAVLVTDFLPSELAGFQRAFAAAPTATLIYAVYSPSVPQFLELAGAAAEGLVWSTVTGTYGDPVGQAFMHRYARAFGQRPGRSHAGIAYDEVHLLTQAWASVQNPRDFRAVADRLRRATYRGVNGSYFLDNERQSGLAYPDMTRDPSLSQAHLVLQIQDGQHRILAPAPYVEASFRPPPWFRSGRASA